ncbi:MAG: hypothetical protein AAB177_04255 [Nitrospirota bacterium]
MEDEYNASAELPLQYFIAGCRKGSSVRKIKARASSALCLFLAKNGAPVQGELPHKPHPVVLGESYCVGSGIVNSSLEGLIHAVFPKLLACRQSQKEQEVDDIYP